jgi:hypothetical protein
MDVARDWSCTTVMLALACHISSTQGIKYGQRFDRCTDSDSRGEPWVRFGTVGRPTGYRFPLLVARAGAVNIRELLEEFGSPTDRPTFLQRAAALVNDVTFFAAANRGPSM